MSVEVWMGFVRHMLTMVGGLLIAKGWLDESTMPEVLGAVMTLVGFVWSYMQKVDAKKKLAVVKK